MARTPNGEGSNKVGTVSSENQQTLKERETPIQTQEDSVGARLFFKAPISLSMHKKSIDLLSLLRKATNASEKKLFLLSCSVLEFMISSNGVKLDCARECHIGFRFFIAFADQYPLYVFVDLFKA